MSQATAAKAKRESDDEAPVKPAAAPIGPSLIHTGIIALTAICCAALIGYAGITVTNLVMSHPEPALQSTLVGRFVIERRQRPAMSV